MSDDDFDPFYQITYYQHEGYHVRYTTGLGSTTLGECYTTLQSAKNRALRHYEKRYSRPSKTLVWKDLGGRCWLCTFSPK